MPGRSSTTGWCATCLGIRIEWDGAIPDGAYLIAVKHQSMMEAVDTLHFAQCPVVVMKCELTTIPLFGWVTRRYGVIGVDRDARASCALGDDEGGQAGDRRRPAGDHLSRRNACSATATSPPLQSGFAGLHRALGLPVVPVAHDVGRLWHKGLVKRSGTVHFKVGKHSGGPQARRDRGAGPPGDQRAPGSSPRP